MKQVIEILNNKKYKQCLKHICNQEKDRIYCRHGLDHAIDVARIAYIMALEENICITKEVIYATALVHDIGRAGKDQDHAAEGAILAKEILYDCGFDGDIVETMLIAIAEHSNEQNHSSPLGSILYRADKASRNCSDCPGYNTCNKSLSIKQKEFIY